jgi:hypothetical protein
MGYREHWDRREKIQALSLAKDVYAMKLELLTNATVLDDAIRFVNSKSSSLEGDSKCKGIGKEKDETQEQLSNKAF